MPSEGEGDDRGAEAEPAGGQAERVDKLPEDRRRLFEALLANEELRKKFQGNGAARGDEAAPTPAAKPAASRGADRQVGKEGATPGQFGGDAAQWASAWQSMLANGYPGGFPPGGFPPGGFPPGGSPGGFPGGFPGGAPPWAGFGGAANQQQPWPGAASPWQQLFQSMLFGNPMFGGMNPMAALLQGMGGQFPGGNPFPGGAPFPGGGPFPGAPPPGPPWSPLVAMKPSGSRLPFFCVHAITGSAFPYQNLAIHARDDQPIYGLQAQGLDGRQEPLDKLEEMAALYIGAIREVQPKGPYRIGGYSFGGWVAYEMAQQLARDGERVSLLAMLGTGIPLSAAHAGAAEYAAMAIQYLEDLNRLVMSSVVAEHMPGAAEFAKKAKLTSFLSPIQRVIAGNNIALLRYAPRPFQGGLDIFITAEQRMMHQADPTLGWRTLCLGAIESHSIEGNHLSMFQEPYVRDLAAKLTTCLERGE